MGSSPFEGNKFYLSSQKETKAFYFEKAALYIFFLLTIGYAFGLVKSFAFVGFLFDPFLNVPFDG